MYDFPKYSWTSSTKYHRWTWLIIVRIHGARYPLIKASCRIIIRKGVRDDYWSVHCFFRDARRQALAAVRQWPIPCQLAPHY